MSDAFDQLVPEAQDFCRRLSENNTRDWFHANKAEYATRLKAPAEMLIETLRPQLAEITGTPCTGKLFRINRDLRFARDKPPYKEHLHMLWYAPAEGDMPLGWFLGIERDRVRTGAGWMQFGGEALTRWRAALDGPHGEEIDHALGAMMAQGCDLREPALKRVPPPYPRDHPRGALLRRRELTLWSVLPVPERDFDVAVLNAFRFYWPALQVIREAMEVA